jgi:hypothetical protein
MPTGHAGRPYTARRRGYDAAPSVASSPTGGLPLQRWNPRIVAFALAVLATLATACTSAGGGGPSSTTPPATTATTPTASANGQIYDANGVTFSYPTAWQPMKLADTSASTGSFDWTFTIGLDERNLVNVGGSTIAGAITPGNVDARAHSIELQVQNVFTQAGGAMTGRPVRLEVGGLPAMRFDGEARTPAGARVRTRLVLVFDGTTEYQIACQYEDASARRLLRGCEEIVSSFVATPA